MDGDNPKTGKYGFKVKLNHVFPEKRTQRTRPRWNQIWELVPLGIRYFFYYIYMWCHGRKPLMDYFNVINGKQIYGVPIGGIGAGTIGRGFKGEFCRYQLRPGIYQYETLKANTFIVTIKNEKGETVYQKPLTSMKAPKDRLQSWKWNFNGENADYLGLYPRSWTVFNIPEQNIILTCRQVSPVIPNNYKDSSIPGAVFVWNVRNNSNETKRISITFSFQNGIGEKGDRNGGCWSEVFKNGDVSGGMIHHSVDGMGYTFGVSAREKAGVEVSRLKEWNPLGSGKELWDALYDNGNFPDCDKNPSRKTSKGEQLGCAVCSQTTVASQSEIDLEFSLVWDMPKINFVGNKKQYWRYYTRYFGRSGEAAPKLSRYCLENYSEWEKEIEVWQEPILKDEKLPDWYKSAIFNETYFVSDGGTVWLDVEEEEAKGLEPDDPRIEYGRFAYLEGHEYRMYNTYDVHFYASFTLAMLWPKLQTVLQRDFCDTIPREDRSRRWQLFDGDVTYRKVKNSIPHDLGDPYEEPFLKINSYPVHDVSEWRDLNVKFVLQCYRDYSLTKDLDQLKYVWENVCVLMKGALRWDKDGDGLIENHGCPDQTYDTWTMLGPSAYCGSLWLAALQCTCEMAKILSDDAILNQFSEILQRAKSAFQDKLWNGTYYNFDCSPESRSKSIMSDQLCGLWYLKSSGLQNEILPDSNVASALRTIYENNVLKLKNGTSGAVNGMLPNGQIDTYTIQSEEIWAGVVYGLSSLMIHQGMLEEGFKTAYGIYHTVYERIGLGFETPEALYESKGYRAVGYMRPLSIWSMQLAWEMRKKSN